MLIRDQRTGGKNAFDGGRAAHDGEGTYDEETLGTLREIGEALAPACEVIVRDWSLMVRGEPVVLFAFLQEIRTPNNPAVLGVDAGIEGFTVGDFLSWSFA
jgi:hypothetical protein